MSHARWTARLADQGDRGRPRHPIEVAERAPRVEPEPPLPKYVLSMDETAAYLGVSRPVIQSMINDGRLPFFKLGTRTLIRRADVEAFVDAAVSASYLLRLPRTLEECQIAANTCLQEADTLAHTSARTKHFEHRQQATAAARAYRQLGIWFRWNAGESFEDISA